MRGVGLGNIFSEGPIKLRNTAKQSKNEAPSNKPDPMEPSTTVVQQSNHPAPTQPTTTVVQQPKRSDPIQPSTTVVQQPKHPDPIQPSTTVVQQPNRPDPISQTNKQDKVRPCRKMGAQKLIS